MSRNINKDKKITIITITITITITHSLLLNVFKSNFEASNRI